MTPREAGEIELEEPDWREVFERECARWPRLPRYLQEDSAFESVLQQWRRFHFVWQELDGQAKRLPASAQAGVIALAQLGIMPPRFLIKDLPRDPDGGHQCDDHLWLSIRGEQWRIVGVEDRMLCLEKWRESDQPEYTQIDLSKTRWVKYCEAAVQALNARA